MRIFNSDNDKKIDEVCILLEYSEAVELMNSLKDLVEAKDYSSHQHINNSDYSKEITIALYDKTGNLEHFADRFKELILNDK